MGTHNNYLLKIGQLVLLGLHLGKSSADFHERICVRLSNLAPKYLVFVHEGNAWTKYCIVEECLQGDVQVPWPCLMFEVLLDQSPPTLWTEHCIVEDLQGDV
jgi:hypothetical protein